MKQFTWKGLWFHEVACKLKGSWVIFFPPPTNIRTRSIIFLHIHHTSSVLFFCFTKATKVVQSALLSQEDLSSKCWNPPWYFSKYRIIDNTCWAAGSHSCIYWLSFICFFVISPPNINDSTYYYLLKCSGIIIDKVCQGLESWLLDPFNIFIDGLCRVNINI